MNYSNFPFRILPSGRIENNEGNCYFTIGNGREQLFFFKIGGFERVRGGPPTLYPPSVSPLVSSGLLMSWKVCLADSLANQWDHHVREIDLPPYHSFFLSFRCIVIRTVVVEHGDQVFSASVRQCEITISSAARNSSQIRLESNSALTRLTVLNDWSIFQIGYYFC